MRNVYKVIDYSELGIPSVEVYGAEFHYQDLYEMVGVNRFMTTFELRKGSISHEKYGDSVLGVIYYGRKGLDSLERSLSDGSELTKKRACIDSPSRSLSEEKKGDLRYSGVLIEDIESISFLPHVRKIENHITGEKKVPNVIEVKADFSGLDHDVFKLNYLISKHNSGVKIAQYEKEQLIGITLAFNNGIINSRELKEFGFTEEDLKINLNIWFHLYKVKERRGVLTEVDKTNYSEVKSILTMSLYNKVMKELNLSGINNHLKDSDKLIIKSIFQAVYYFYPSILLHGKNQVYWDVDSYIHITLRHSKEYQLGHFQKKTPLLYKPKEMKSLIEKVLQRINSEIETYLSENRAGDFIRKGTMAIEYNGDHYHLRINQDGRLVQFHSVKSEFNNSMNLATE